MHFALLVLILGGLLGSFSRVSMKGMALWEEIPVVFEHSSDEYEVVLNDSLSVSLPPWGKLGAFQLGPYDFKIIKSCEKGLLL